MRTSKSCQNVLLIILNNRDTSFRKLLKLLHIYVFELVGRVASGQSWNIHVVSFSFSDFTFPNPAKSLKRHTALFGKQISVTELTLHH